MRHLDPERLAALGDGAPTADEAAHLADCAFCERERLTYRELLSLSAAERAVPLAAPLNDWDALAARLAEEGIVRREPGSPPLAVARVVRGGVPEPARRGGTGTRTSPARRVWLRAAAAVLLAGGGAAVGRATAGMPLPASASAGGNQSAAQALANPSTGGSGASSASGAPDSQGAILTVEDALALMRRAESDYRLAAAYIAASDTSAIDGVDRYRARLAALDRVSDAALAAVNEAPADPVVNQYLISARAARAVTLQQLNSSLPPGMSLTSY